MVFFLLIPVQQRIFSKNTQFNLLEETKPNNLDWWESCVRKHHRKNSGSQNVVLLGWEHQLYLGIFWALSQPYWIIKLWVGGPINCTLTIHSGDSDICQSLWNTPLEVDPSPLSGSCERLTKPELLETPGGLQ